MCASTTGDSFVDFCLYCRPSSGSYLEKHFRATTLGYDLDDLLFSRSPGPGVVNYKALGRIMPQAQRRSPLSLRRQALQVTMPLASNLRRPENQFDWYPRFLKCVSFESMRTLERIDPQVQVPIAT